MLIKFSSNNPLFIQKIELLKLQYKTTITTKAVRLAIEDFYEIERKCEILEAEVESMEAEINRLRLLLDINKSTNISNKIAHLRSLRQ